MPTKQRVFVTGASGFLGKAVCRRLTEAGIQVTRYCLNSRQYDHTDTHGSTVYGDSFEKESFARALMVSRPEFIVHLASAGVLDGDTNPATLFEVNVRATVNLVEAAALVGDIKIIHTGTCSEYACQDGLISLESSPIGPPNYYGATKAASVQLLLGLCRLMGVPAVVLRPFNIYGQGESPKRLIPYLIEQQFAGRVCELTHGLQKKDFLYIDDAANGYLHAINHFEKLDMYGIYNLCTGIPTSLRSVGEKIASLMNGDTRLFHWGAKPARAAEPQIIVGDPRRFVEATGWIPSTELDIGLHKTIVYYRERAARTSAYQSSIPSAAA